MSKTVSLTIDGKTLRAPVDMNLIDAAELAGIHIPNLCYLKGMKGVGACRLCMVEVEGSKNPMIGCTTKVKEGMVVRTDTEPIREQRKFVIDLILSMHPLDCMTCKKAGICNLQKYAHDFDMKKTSFTMKSFGHPVDVGNPFIKMSPDYCILCGRCIRICKEQDTNVLEFMGRGVGAKVTTVVDRSLHESNCTFCGSCIDACPVNSIIEYDRFKSGREWEYEKNNAVCMLCGNACDTVVSTQDGRIKRINTGAEKGSAMKYICAYGRFGYDYAESETRITTPMIRVNDELKETTWDEAIKVIAERIGKGGKDVGVVATSSMVNEDALTLRTLAGDVLKTKNVDTTMSLYADQETLVNSDKASINDADLIVLVGINPSQRLRILPMLSVSTRRRIARGGAKLIVINSDETKMDKIATVKLGGDEITAIKSLIKAAADKGVHVDKKLAADLKGAVASEDATKAAELFAAASNPIIYTAASLFNASSNLSMLKGNVVTVSYESNAKGIALMGLVSAGKTFRELITKGSKVLYVVGSVPMSRRPDTDFLIVEDSHMTEIAKQADVFLPSLTYLESHGTIMDFKGRTKFIPVMVEPMGNAKSHRDIFVKLSKALDKPIKKATEAEVKTKLKKAAKKVQLPFTKREGLDVQPEMIIDAINESLLSSPRLMWLKEAERKLAAQLRAQK